MEKQRRNSSKKSCRRLLKNRFIIFLLFSLFVSEKIFAADYVAEVQELSGENKFYVNEDIKFTVTIPDVSSSHVVYNMNSIKVDYQENEKSKKQKVTIPFNIYKKSDFLNSTRIEFYISFEKEGIYTFQPESVIVNGTKKTFEIKPIHAVENPENYDARLVIEFYENGKKSQLFYSDDKIPDFKAEAFTDLNFTVGIQFARAYSNFYYDIPENSLFEQTKIYDGFSVEVADDRIVKIADFTWKALASEKMDFPKISVTAVNNNNSSVNLRFPKFQIEFTNPSDSGVKNQNNSESYSRNSYYEKEYLDNAFFIEPSEIEKTKILSKEECIEIAEKFREEEFNYMPFMIACLVLFLLLIIVQVFIRKRSRNLKIFFAVLACFAFASFVYLKSKSSEKFGVFTGGIIYSVPDENSSSLMGIDGGKKIMILKTGEEWSRIRYDNIEGWIPSEMLVRI